MSEEVISKEKQAWDTVRKKDFESFRNIMADDGLYVSHHGLLDPARSVKSKPEAPAKPPINNRAVRRGHRWIYGCLLETN